MCFVVTTKFRSNLHDLVYSFQFIYIIQLLGHILGLQLRSEFAGYVSNNKKLE